MPPPRQERRRSRIREEARRRGLSRGLVTALLVVAVAAAAEPGMGGEPDSTAAATVRQPRPAATAPT